MLIDSVDQACLSQISCNCGTYKTSKRSSPELSSRRPQLQQCCRACYTTALDRSRCSLNPRSRFTPLVLTLCHTSTWIRLIKRLHKQQLCIGAGLWIRQKCIGLRLQPFKSTYGIGHPIWTTTSVLAVSVPYRVGYIRHRLRGSKSHRYGHQ